MHAQPAANPLQSGASVKAMCVPVPPAVKHWVRNCEILMRFRSYAGRQLAHALQQNPLCQRPMEALEALQRRLQHWWCREKHPHLAPRLLRVRLCSLLLAQPPRLSACMFETTTC